MPLPMETFMALVSSIVLSCHQISPLATFYCCLSDRKTFSENPFISSYRLYRHLFILSPFAMRLFSSLSLLLLHSLCKRGERSDKAWQLPIVPSVSYAFLLGF